MKILKKHTISKKEDTTIIPFLDFLYNGSEIISFSAVQEDKNKRPDYFVDTTNTLIEVKEIHDKDANQKHALWGTIASRLQKAVDQDSLLSQVKGTFLVNTPERFKTPTDQQSFYSASTKVLQAVIDNKTFVNVFGVKFGINKVSDQESIVVYGSMGGAGSIDPADIVYQNIKDKLATANKQLSFIPNDKKPSKRILLLVKKYYFPLYEWDLFKAISLLYDDLLGYENIDEIWYQIETQSKEYIHKLLYRKSFFEEFEKEDLTTVKNDEYKMFASWFSTLSDMGDDKKNKLLKALQFFLHSNKAHTIFPDDENREQMVRLGLWLLENKPVEDAIWLIDQFIDDPNPSEPGNYEGKPEFNYDQIIRDGKDAVVITTVMGHLAWVIKELARKSERGETSSLVKAYDYTEKILTSRKNLYVIQQWLVPLVEIANRRLWLAENNPDTYKRFRNLILDKEGGLIEKYAEYPALTKFLIDVLDFFKDLTTDEVQFILEKLIDSEEGFRLLIYYALYRENHYKKDSDVGRVLGKLNPAILEYSPTYAYNKLEEVSLDAEDKHPKLRSHLAWQCWRIVDDSPNEFGHLKHLLDNLFNSPYNKETFSNLFHILGEEYEGKTNVCHAWLMEYIKKIAMYVDDDEKGRSTWTSLDMIINIIADYRSQDLPYILGKLTDIWLKGAYIGDLNVIFTAYQNIKDEELKQQVKVLSQGLHKQMQEANPRVKDISWI